MTLKVNAKYLIVLVLIILLGFFFRTYHLSKVPAGFFADEAAIGYNAYKLLTTGADEYRIPFPFFFRSFGDYRLPVPIYSNIPFVALFGLNEFSVRLTAAFFGTLTILVVFLLGKKMFRNPLIGLCCAFFLAISPWHIHFSRFGSEYIYFPFWFSLGLYFFLLGFENKKFLIISFFVFGISLYSYYPALFTVPLFILFLLIIYFKEITNDKKNIAIGLFIFLVTMIPFFIGTQNGTVLTRWQRVSIIKDQSAGQSIPKIVQAYVAHFSPTFLFEKGDIEYPGHFITRFSVRGMGELYWIQLPLLLLGFFTIFKKHRKAFCILFLWLTLYPLGSSLTGTDGGGPFAFRSILGVIPFQILSAIGTIFLFYFFKNKIVKIVLAVILTIVIIIPFNNYLHRYFVDYPLYSSNFWGWQYGARDVMDHFIKADGQYDDLFLMGSFNSPEIFILFYDPQNRCQGKCQVGGLEKINVQKKQLFAIGSDRLQEIKFLHFKADYTIFYPNRDPAFFIGEFQNN